MNITRPLLERRTKNPIELGETRVVASRFLHGVNGFIHGDEIVKELFRLTNSIFGTDVEVVRISDIDFLRKLRQGEWVGLVFRADHLEKHRLGNILTVSFFAKRISNGKGVFSGNFRIRLL